MLKKAFNAIVAASLVVAPFAVANAQSTTTTLESVTITLDNGGNCVATNKDRTLTLVMYASGNAARVSKTDEVSVYLDKEGNLIPAQSNGEQAAVAREAQALQPAVVKWQSVCATVFPGKTPWTAPSR